jgi:hypothetical protein
MKIINETLAKGKRSVMLWPETRIEAELLEKFFGMIEKLRVDLEAELIRSKRQEFQSLRLEESE